MLEKVVIITEICGIIWSIERGDRQNIVIKDQPTLPLYKYDNSKHKMSNFWNQKLIGFCLKVGLIGQIMNAKFQGSSNFLIYILVTSLIAFKICVFCQQTISIGDTGVTLATMNNTIPASNFSCGANRFTEFIPQLFNSTECKNLRGMIFNNYVFVYWTYLN